jgi:hypothetical protein
MNPPIAHLQALFTTLAVRFDVPDLVEVSTFSHCLPPCAPWQRQAVNAHLRNFRLWIAFASLVFAAN